MLQWGPLRTMMGLERTIALLSIMNKILSKGKKGEGGDGTSGPEEHWNDHVLKEVSKEQIGFLAEGLFKELWARCGKDVAIDQVSLMIAEVQFSRGFDLLYKVHDNTSRGRSGGELKTLCFQALNFSHLATIYLVMCVQFHS